MIKLESFSFTYPQAPSPIFKDIDLELAPGTLTLVTGPSGGGKSTLLRSINGLIPHFSGGKISGSIQVFGSNPILEGPEKLAAKVGFVFQEPESQFVFDVVEDEIAFALENMGLLYEEMHQRVDLILNQLGLAAIRKRAIHTISGGEKQLVAIASVLVTNPQVLLLDEPTSQLDPTSADRILRLCVSLKQRLGLTILISEHRLERLLPYTENVIYIKKDHSLKTGAPKEIIPTMSALPPVVRAANKLNIKPIPLVPHDFPEISFDQAKSPKVVHTDREPSSQDNLLSIKHLKTTIEKKEILNNISLTLGDSEILVLMGRNGAGKTTLLRSILGLTSTAGERVLDGHRMENLSLAQVIKKIAYLPQNPNDLLFAETVLDELKITLKNHGKEKSTANLCSFLSHFGLEKKSQRYPRDLSIGERQRAALAAITVHDPKILFLDEPTRGLDYLAKENLIQLIRHWRNHRKGILLVTHDVEFAAGLADRVAILDAGKIIFNGSPRVAFTQFPMFKTQMARIFPNKNWILPEDIPNIENVLT